MDTIFVTFLLGCWVQLKYSMVRPLLSAIQPAYYTVKRYSSVTYSY